MGRLLVARRPLYLSASNSPSPKWLPVTERAAVGMVPGRVRRSLNRIRPRDIAVRLAVLTARVAFLESRSTLA